MSNIAHADAVTLSHYRSQRALLSLDNGTYIGYIFTRWRLMTADQHGIYPLSGIRPGLPAGIHSHVQPSLHSVQQKDLPKQTLPPLRKNNSTLESNIKNDQKKCTLGLRSPYTPLRVLAQPSNRDQKFE
ncbi:hypothetical protein EMCG_03038 [[Emmonsia] crescens]|uniref:Uncharacterized protein n=1 Tax=[Emmonsia] crescens TaxID=73230 RepID=A0A0G2HX11_9EURO|nr:hypothetical protein EMCG_03038 [Emmonsia crescens UAMH 3008]